MFLLLHMQQSAKSSQQAGNRSLYACLCVCIVWRLTSCLCQCSAEGPAPEPSTSTFNGLQSEGCKPGGVTGWLSCLMEITTVLCEGIFWNHCGVGCLFASSNLLDEDGAFERLILRALQKWPVTQDSLIFDQRICNLKWPNRSFQSIQTCSSERLSDWKLRKLLWNLLNFIWSTFLCITAFWFKGRDCFHLEKK